MIRFGNARLHLRWRLVSLSMVAVVAFSAVHASNACAEESSGRRVLRFPADRAVGTLLWRMPGDSGAWKPIGKTRGSVRVPAEAVVRLDVAQAASNDLAWLGDLPPDDIQELNLHGTDVSDEALHHVTRLTGLRSIDLRSTRISDAGLEGFDALVNLEEVWLDAIGVNREGFGVGDGAMRWLGRLPKLRTINLRYAKVTDAGLAELVHCGSLTELVLAGTQVSDAGLPHLMKLPRLDTLFLGFHSHGDGANITDEGLKTVGKLVNLRLLDLSGTKISGEGLAHLKDLKNLKTLHLESTDVSEADLTYLEPFKSLEWLSLHDEGRITDVAAEHLARLKSLRHLDVHFNITDKGVASLASLPHLEMFTLNGDGITDASAECIASMKSLKSLSFEACPITDVTLQAVADLTKLVDLTVSQTRVSGDGFSYLRHLPKLSRLMVNFDPAEEQMPVGQPRPHLREIGKLAQVRDLAIWGRSLLGSDLKDLAGLNSVEHLQLTMPVDDEGASALAHLKRLRGLRTNAGILTDLGLRHLGLLERLEFLEIEGRFTDEGLLSLAPLDKLYHLQVRSPNITAAGVQALARQLPSLQHAEGRQN